MKPEMNGGEIGQQLGLESAEATITKVEAYCKYEKQRIEISNQAQIVAIKAEFSLLLDEERELRERLRHAPPPGDLRHRKRKGLYYWVVALILTAAVVYFTLYTFAPFRMGSAAYLYCLSIAAVAPFVLGLALEKWNGGKLLKTFIATACVAAVMSLVLLAVIRGDLLAQQFVNSNPVVIFDDAQPTPESLQTDFYRATLVLLRLVMALLAVAMDLGAGLALHEAWRMGSDNRERWGSLQGRLTELLSRKIELAFEVTTLQNEPAIFVNRFWSNFYRTMLAHTLRSAMTKLLLVVIAFSLFLVRAAAAELQLNLVIAVDLSQSVAVHAPGQPSEFQKNIEAITKLLAEVPASSRVTIIGITDQSFSEPYILLSATIPDDPGYFGERLIEAHTQLVQAWIGRCSRLEPRFKRTDILGALEVASQLFNQRAWANKNILAIYSDMRNSTVELDLELEINDGTESKKIPIDLHGVEISVSGVDAAARSLTYWDHLRSFWRAYFQQCGAHLKRYSALRTALELDPKKWSPRLASAYRGGPP